MWQSLDGLRRLDGDEATLVQRSVRQMLEAILEELDDDLSRDSTAGTAHHYGIDWFDQWEPGQRIWLLHQVTFALLTDCEPPSPSAMYEATVDAIFCQVFELVTQEVESGSTLDETTSWKNAVLRAYKQQSHRQPTIDASETEMKKWWRLVSQLTDAILAVPAYQKAESFRDQNIKHCQRFLEQRGLPVDFLQRIPPMVNTDDTQRALDALAKLL